MQKTLKRLNETVSFIENGPNGPTTRNAYGLMDAHADGELGTVFLATTIDWTLGGHDRLCAMAAVVNKMSSMSLGEIEQIVSSLETNRDG